MPTLSDLILGRDGNQPNALDRFKDTWLHAAINSPLGAEGLARAYYKHKGYNDTQINSAIDSLNKEYQQKYGHAPVIQGVRPGHPLDYVSPDNIGRGAVTLLGSLFGGVDPTYAVGGFGKNAVRRIASQAGVQGGASYVRQQVEKDTGQRTKFDHGQAARDATMGAVFQGGAEALGAAARRTPEAINLGTDIVPYKKPTVNDDGSAKMGQFASQKDAAMHMRANGFTPATHDIVAHGDDSYSLVPKAPANITPEDFNDVPQTITPEDFHEAPETPEPQPPAPVEQPPVPTAQDGLPGNGSVPPMDPQMIAKIMGNPDGAAPSQPEDLANLPSQPPVEQPPVEQAPPPSEQGYMNPNVVDFAHEAQKRQLTAMGVDPYLQHQIMNQDISFVPQEIIDHAHHFGADQLEDIMTRLMAGNKVDLKDELDRSKTVYPTNDNSPSKEEITSNPGVNARRMAKMLGPQLYGDPSHMGSVTVKEVLQNSFDAVKDAMAKHGMEQGRIAIHTDNEKRSITMHDNGIGMAPETLGGKFLQIAGTGKEGDNSSGGFGIAKMLFLYGNKELHVKTMRDGKVSEMHTTGEQLFDSLEDPVHAPKIQVRAPTDDDHKDFPDGHGTKISLVVPEKFQDPQTNEDKEIAMPHSSHHGEPSITRSPLFHNVEVHYNGNLVRNIGTRFPAEKHSPFTHVRFGWGSADIYVSNEPDKYTSNNNLHYLSNGLWQFSKKLSKTPSDPWAPPVPHTFYIDIHPKVKPEEPGYPFNFNRQSLTPEAHKELQKVVDYINKLYAHKSLGDDAKSFGSISYIDPQTGKASKPVELKPDIPVKSKGFEGLNPGDQVTIRDGRMYVNGHEMPALTPDQLKDEIPSHNELMVNPALIDAHSIMVHDNTRVQIPGDSSPEEEQQSITEHMREQFGEHFDDMMHTVGKTFLEIRNMVVELGSEYHDLANQAVGISFDKGYRGVNIRVPFKGQFVNPLVPESDVPLEQGYGIIGTMVHELAHEKVRVHNAEFPAEMQKLQMKLAASQDFMIYWADKAQELTKYADVFKYGKELFDKEYVESRAKSFEDGAYDERTEGGNEGNSNGVSPTGKDDGSPEGLSEGAAPQYPSIEPRGAPGKGSVPRSQNAVLKALADVLEQGKPYRAETTQRIAAERSERIRAAMAAGSKRTGREALYAELKALKGDMSKAYIQPIAQHFTPEEIDGLLDMVKKKLGPGYESIKARAALNRLFDKEKGELPTEGELRLLQKVLPNSIIKALLSDEEGSLNLSGMDKVTNVAGVTRAVKTIGDFGVPFRQCIMLIGTKAYWKAMPEIFKGMSSEEMFQKSWELISTDPDYFWMQHGGVAFTNLNHHDLTKREEFAPSPLAEKIPLTRRSERGYTGYLNMVRYHTFKRLLQDARKLGVDPTSDTKYLKELGDLTNKLTGRGSLGKKGDRAAPFLSAMFFSPRLNASRLQILFDTVTWWRHPPQVRKELGRAFLAYAIYMGTILGIANAVGDKFGVHVEMDPRSTEFARIQIGHTYFDPSGSFQPFVRTAWQFFSGEKKNASGEIQPLGEGYGQPTRKDLIENFLRGKLSPNAAMVMDMLSGPDFLHPKNVVGEVNSFTQHSPENWDKNPLVNMVIPMGLEGGIEAGHEYGAKSPLPYAAGLAETFGIGAKTYEPRERKDRSKKEFDDGFDKNEFGSDFGKDAFE